MSDDELHLDDDDEARVDALLRSITADDLELETPPDTIWAGIEAEIAAESTDAIPNDADDDPVAPVISIADRRRPAVLAAAVAAVLVVIAGLTVLFAGDSDEPVEFAAAELTWTPDYVPAGEGFSTSATLVEDGERIRVRLSDTDLPAAPEGEDIELWLIGVNDDEIAIIQTLGIVDDPARPGTFDVPDSYVFDDYETVLVDLSFEPRDGNAEHSGATFVRGPVIET